MGWQVGDLAVCVNNERSNRYPEVGIPLQRGRAYLVVTVVDGPNGFGLRLKGVKLPLRDDYFSAHRFRKVQPYQERFAKQLRNALPVRAPEKVRTT